MGGLRPGGGDPWNNQMKTFLRNHWEHVTMITNGFASFEQMAEKVNSLLGK